MTERAIQSQGTVFKVTDGGSPTTFQIIPNVVDFNGPGGQASVLDASNLSSTRREKLMGLADEGQVTLTINWDPDDTVHQLLRTLRTNRTRAEFRIELADSSPSIGVAFGYVLGVSLSGGVDSIVKASVVIEIDGALTWS